MFRTSKKGTQLDMFTSISGMLRGTAFDQFQNEQGWHNQFREQVVKQIDENIFSVVFDDQMGAPNASIRVLIGMMALKEAFGWSDGELFERCRFDLLVRSALGLFNIHESIPTESTYYLFRKRILTYKEQNQTDLIEQVFQQITHYQAKVFEVNGRSIRMDSKLIGSNIAWSSRYELIHDTLGLFFRDIDKTGTQRLTPEDLSLLKDISTISGSKVVYRSTREDIQQRLYTLGVLCYKVLCVYEEKENVHYSALKRVFEDHFHMDENGKTQLKSKKDIATDSLQSPFDQDCAYRNKDGLQIKGYSVNITETCDEGSVNLITDVQVTKANKPDSAFVKPAIEETSNLLGHYPQDMHADGAYQNPDNVAYCREKGINHFFTGLQGPVGRYDLELCHDQLTVTDTHTGEIIPAQKSNSGKWVIKTGKGYRYFSQQEIDVCRLRKEIENMPEEKRQKRNNVEATIFQLSYHTRNNKTRYRGLIKHKMWALFRCIWINLRRIVSYVEQICQRTKIFGQIAPKNQPFSQKNELKNSLVLIFNLYQTFLEFFVYLNIKLLFNKVHFS